MASSSLNKNKEHDRSKSVNIIDDLAAKIDQLLKGNHGQYAGYQKNYQPRTYVLSQLQNNPPQMQKHQNTQSATSAPVAVPQDETKAMLQQMLQGQ
ncbi:hypothetical protein F2Q69_00004495 [Brassica cretica]|uniref:Uncharacterized protein n=1 Tax=Brassica cretica TaxID=69181 RepID=A0A8S9P870_BRACR|nr:hypothetical protein F2Q69_00004495 [Brassica cretica]